jgi:hypothetical protein
VVVVVVVVVVMRLECHLRLESLLRMRAAVLHYSLKLHGAILN